MVDATDLLPLTVLCDTRERRPWTFEPYPVVTRTETLSTGDYTLPAWCTRDGDTGTYHPRLAVERKSRSDFLDALTWDRERFADELRRAADWPEPLSVVVAASWERLVRHPERVPFRDVHPNQVVGTVAAWSRRFNVAFHVADTRPRAERCAFYLLLRGALLDRHRRNRPADGER